MIIAEWRVERYTQSARMVGTGNSEISKSNRVGRSLLDRVSILQVNLLRPSVVTRRLEAPSPMDKAVGYL